MPNHTTVNVAVIDTGVDVTQTDALVGAVALKRGADGDYTEAHDASDEIGHGTAVLSILTDRLSNAALWSVGLADWPQVDSSALVVAIRWCIDADMQVVNISAGCTGASARQELAAICQQAADAGIILIAAEHNDRLVSYPAHLPSVIGVRGSPMADGNTYHYRPGEPIECLARGDAQRLRWGGGKEVFVQGSSFAAPRITATVVHLRQQHPGADLAQIRRLLRDGASQVLVPEAGSDAQSAKICPVAPATTMRRVALYPYTKEMHALIRYPDLLPFRVTGIADPPGRGLVGKDAGQSIGAEAAGIQVQARLADAVPGADTLILGYLRQLGSLRNRDLHREYLQLALERGLNVFSFEPLADARYDRILAAGAARGLWFRWPGVSHEQAKAILSGAARHGPVDRPVLGVFGTSASQGKFTLQLALRRRLLQLGYRLAQIGTEHHSGLFGMDFVFPMGHGSTVEPDVTRYPELLDGVMRRLCAEGEPDLIMVGSQSGTVPFDCTDQRTLSLTTLAFLMGTRPDACILVVNAIDPESYIEATIEGLRSVGQAQTIALAVSDQSKHLQQRHGRGWLQQTQAGPDEMAGVLKRLEQRFELPAVRITDTQGIARLAELAVRCFSQPDQETDACNRKMSA